VRLLLSHDADLLIQAEDGRTALDVAKNVDTIKEFLKQIRWNRRKALLIVLAENGYLHLTSHTPSNAAAPLKYEDVLGNKELVRHIVGYI
jgi:hypothetical protein